MRWVIAAICTVVLSGCGADGEPEPPTRNATITLSDGGLYGSARVGVSQGPVTVSLGLGL